MVRCYAGFLAVCAGGLAACGEAGPSLTLSLVEVAPPSAWDGVARVRVLAQGVEPSVADETPVFQGTATLKASFPKSARVVTVLGLDGGGKVVSAGRTPPLHADPAARPAAVPFFRFGPFVVAKAPLSAPRVGPVVAALADGRAWVAGGAGTTTTEIYEPARAAFAAAPDLPGEIESPQSVALAEASKGVLVCGGYANDAGSRRATRTAAVFDPTTAGITAQTMGVARARHALAALPDGRALIVGGVDATGVALGTTEVFSRFLGFRPGPALAAPRADAGVAALLDGRVLVAGGTDPAGQPVATAEIVDVVAGTVKPAASMSQAHAGPLVVRSPSGPSWFVDAAAPAELYLELESRWVTRPAASLSDGARLTPLVDGRALVSGGTAAGKATAETQLLDLFAGTLSKGPAMSATRRRHAAAQLADGTVLVVGGEDAAGQAIATAELWHPSLVHEFDDPAQVIDFDDGQSAGFVAQDPERWAVAFEAGNKKLFLNATTYAPPDGQGLGEFAVLAGPSLADFTMTVRVKTAEQLAANRSADLAVAFGYQDPRNYYYVVFNADASQTEYSRLSKLVKGREQILDAFDPARPPPIADRLEHEVRVARRGDLIVVSFDGSEVARATDFTFPRGLVGFGAQDDAAYFDSVAIRRGAEIP